MKKYFSVLGVVAMSFIILLFFYNTILFGKLPIPIDSLVGLYHPWRDVYAAKFPRGMPFKNFLITDPIRQQIPWRKLAIDEWKKGRIPSWNPTSFSGTPLAANIQSGAFYPLNIIFMMVPFAASWSVLIILQPLLAWAWMYAYLRNRRVSVRASAFGSFVFAFSGSSVSWMTWGTIGHVVLWIPLLLLSIDKMFTEKAKGKKAIVWVLVGVFSIICQLTAGHAQVALYSLLLSFVYIGGRYACAPTSGYKALMKIGLAVLLGSILVSPLWYAVVSFGSTTNRFALGSLWKTEGFFIPIVHLVQFLAPDYFGNPSTLNYWGVWNYGEMIGYVSILGLLFVLIAAGAYKKRYIRFWLTVVVVSLIASTANPISSIPYQLHIPVLSSMQPTRLLIIIDLALAILAAHGADMWLSRDKRNSHLWPSIALGFILLGLWASIRFLPPAAIEVAKRNMILPTILFACYFTALTVYHLVRKAVIIPVFLGFIVLFDLFRFGWKYTPFVDGQYFFPESHAISFLQTKEKPFRIMTLDDRVLPPDTHAYYDLESIGGYDPIKSDRYERFIAAIEQGRADVRYPFGFERIMTPKNYQSPLFPLLHVRYIVSMSEINNEAMKEVYKEGETRIYEYTKFLPYAYFAQSVLSVNKPDMVLSTMFSSPFDPRHDVVIEGNLTVNEAPIRNDETLRITSYQGSEIHIQSVTQSDRLLATGILYMNGWRAFVDNVEVPMYLANYVFGAIVVPKGTHEIRLTHTLL